MEAANQPSFRPLAVGALYSGIERGLTADALAARALGGSALTVCASLVSASRGRVTDVLEVPSDSVSAQLEHILDTVSPTAARLGILGSRQSASVVFETLREKLNGPLILDVTLSGPSGEDVVGPRGLETLQEGFETADLVTLRLLDAERVAEQKIDTLSDAQVAAQRVAQRGGRRVLVRGGSGLEINRESNNGSQTSMNVDLFYDGDEFALFEAPHLSAENIHGSSSIFMMAALCFRTLDDLPWPTALQKAKAVTAETLRSSVENENGLMDYFSVSSELM